MPALGSDTSVIATNRASNVSIVFTDQRTRQDYATAGEAIAAVEARGSGSVVKFHISPNMPGCLPEKVYRSCALWNYEGGEWTEFDIFAGGRWAGRPE